jgi:elongation factor G
MDTDADGNSVVRARVPYKEVITYARDLRSMTRGTGTYTINVEGYEEMPAQLAQPMIEEYKEKRAEGNK